MRNTRGDLLRDAGSRLLQMRLLQKTIGRNEKIITKKKKKKKAGRQAGRQAKNKSNKWNEIKKKTRFKWRRSNNRQQPSWRS